MAVKKSSFHHFLLRLAGVTGLFVAIVGLVLWLAIGEWSGAYVAGGGGALVLLAVLMELPGLTQGVMSRRGAVGGAVLVQIILAAILFIGINVFSFFHYSRLDLTREN